MSILDEQTTMVTVETVPEFKYVMAWCAGKGKNTSGALAGLLPIHIGVAGDVVGWTDRDDRALTYIPFNQFLHEIGRGGTVK